MLGYRSVGSHRYFLSTSSLLAAAVLLNACGSATDGTTAPRTGALSASQQSASANRVDDGHQRPGAVYIETNGAAGNAIVAFHRAPDGALAPLATYGTGGAGIGGAVDPLQSQFSVVLDEDHDALFAVNAGSNQVSSFRVDESGALTLAGTVSSGGTTPISIAEHGHLLYVLNTSSNTVSGFRTAGNARLVALPNSTRSLASGASGAAAVRFTPDGRFLIVSERVSNRLEVFAVNENGRLGDPVVSPANGSASFGFDITPHSQPVVSETQGSLTSYALNPLTSALTPITASISTHGAASCWVTITADGAFAYTTNAGSNFVSGFAISASGHLTALTANGRTGESGAGATPIDLDHVGARLLYVLNAGRGTIGQFTIGANGSLTAGTDAPAGAPASGLQGIAAY
ncbi:MAG TPA: beta-propeller fold lactonase family protein [Gemmatimonadaceae bacterium]